MLQAIKLSDGNVLSFDLVLLLSLATWSGRSMKLVLPGGLLGVLVWHLSCSIATWIWLTPWKTQMAVWQSWRMPTLQIQTYLLTSTCRNAITRMNAREKRWETVQQQAHLPVLLTGSLLFVMFLMSSWGMQRVHGMLCATLGTCACHSP